MKLLLTILACLVAASAGAQTIKSLGYNTTNGNIVAATNVTFTNSVGFATNARAATRTNLELGGTWLTNTNVTNFRTAIGLGATNDVTFSNITANGIVNAKNATLGTATNAATAQGIQWSGLGGAQHAAIYGAYDGVAEIALSVGTTSNALSDVATFRATGMTVNSNAIVGGTLAVTGNVTLNGSDNLMPNATNAASASSLMTRDLSDDRYTTYVWLTGSSDNQTITNGGFKFLGPSRINSFSLGYGASIPAGYTKFRVLLNFGWLTDPATNSSNFQVFVRFNNMGALSTSTQESEHGSVAGVSLYPTNSPTNGIVGTLTRLGVVNTTNSIYSFRSEYETIPSAWQNNAASNGFFHLQGVAIRNNTGASVTDAFNANHAPVGIIEFRK